MGMHVLTVPPGTYLPPPFSAFPDAFPVESATPSASPAAPPTPVDKAAEDAAQRTKSQLASQGGLGSTLRTGPQGLSGPIDTSFKTLLGQ